MTEKIVPSSFRDPSGYLFIKDGVLYRRIHLSYKDNYDHLIESGLYRALTERNLLIPHEEVRKPDYNSEEVYLDIKPKVIPFISYPYEWSFSQLKDAALLTLEIQKESLSRGMILKDASAYNVQFYEGKPMFIDTLSFQRYEEGKPWVGYKQFCEHFLAPLALMSFNDIRLNHLLRIYLDGIPLDLASRLLPKRTYFTLSLVLHLHSHAWMEKRYVKREETRRTHGWVGKNALVGIITSLEKGIKRLRWSPENTLWLSYYIRDHSYTREALEDKGRLVSEFLDETHPRLVWDLGANTGYFSRLASGKGIYTMSFDNDPACVEVSYIEARKDNDCNLLPLIIDVCNPSPPIGWENRERLGLLDRGKPDLVLALALIHHLAISRNLPLERIAAYLSRMARYLIIEFVPKTDSMIQRMLAMREDIFPDYTRESFENAFAKHFFIKRTEKIARTERLLFLMLGRDNA